MPLIALFCAPYSPAVSVPSQVGATWPPPLDELLPLEDEEEEELLVLPPLDDELLLDDVLLPPEDEEPLPLEDELASERVRASGWVKLDASKSSSSSPGSLVFASLLEHAATMPPTAYAAATIQSAFLMLGAA